MKLRDYFRLAPAFGRCAGRLGYRHLWRLLRMMRWENPQRHEGRLHINSFFPPYPSAAFERFLEAAVARRRVPYSTYFAVTDACPYRCGHCSYGRRAAGQMETPQALTVIEQIKKLGTITIGLTGGEPLLRQDLAVMVKTIGPEAASIVFTTGYGLTAVRAAELKDAGLDCIMIGLESHDAAQHNAVRQDEKSFVTALRAIELGQQAGLYTAISTIASRSKIEDGTLEALAAFGQRLGVREFRILEPIPTGRMQHKSEALLRPEETQHVIDLHKRWNRREERPTLATFSHLESAELFGCGAGYHHLFIDAVGNVCPCDLTPLAFGNVLQEPLAEIWKRMEKYFGQPRRQCFMKQFCDRLETAKADILPLAVEESCGICDALAKDGALPGLYRDFFRIVKQ